MKLKNENILSVDYVELSSNFETVIGTIRNIDLNIKSGSDDASNEAESVDSGCVPDLTPETNWLQVSSTLKYEYDFIMNLMQHMIPKCSEQPSTSSGDKIIRYSDIKDQEKFKDKKKNVNKSNNENEKKSVNAGKDDLAENIHFDKVRKKQIENELRNLKRGKYGNLSRQKAKKREMKLRKHLKVMMKKKEKGVKKIKREENALTNLKSNTEATTENKKIYNNSGQLVYSKFDFSQGLKEKWEENKKRDLNYFMNKVIKEKEKIKSLKSRGNVTDAVKCLENNAWKNAMSKAQGEKVKDDSQKLKKSLDRKMKSKKKSQEKWNERINNVKKNQTVRQQTREKNIKLRKEKQEDKKEKKLTRKEKKHLTAKAKKKKGGKTSRVPGF